MPVLMGGITGVWLATPVAELLSTVMAGAVVLHCHRKRSAAPALSSTP